VSTGAGKRFGVSGIQHTEITSPGVQDGSQTEHWLPIEMPKKKENKSHIGLKKLDGQRVVCLRSMLYASIVYETNG